MKKYAISSDCNACGICMVMTDLLVEDDSGHAQPAKKGYIHDEEMNRARTIVSQCPMKAISIVELSASGKSEILVDDTAAQKKLIAKSKSVPNGKKNLHTSNNVEVELQKLPDLLEKGFDKVKIPDIKKSDVAFDAKKYYIGCPYPQGELRYDYSSEEKAIRAGLAEFNRIAYSQYRKFNLSVFVQYKLDKLKPFYSLEADGFIEKLNRKYSDLLQSFIDEAESLSNGKIKFPENFAEFEAYPGGSKQNAKDIYLYALEHYDDQSVSSGVMHEFHDRSYTNLDDYATYFDTDDTETYDGKGFFGGDKYSYKYCYRGVQKAVDEFIKDLKESMNYVDIDEFAFDKVNGAVNAYKEDAKNKFAQKLQTFRDLLKSY